MTFAAEEISIEDGRPIELYEFTAGSSTFFYTSAPTTRTIAASTYTAKVIQRTNIVDGTEKRNNDFQIVLPTTDPVAQLFVGILTGVRVFLTVKRLHLGDATVEVLAIYNGVASGAAFTKLGKECTITFRSTISSAGRTFPRRTCQAQCNHVLYDDATCRVDNTLSDFRTSATTVSSVSNNDMTVASLNASFIDGWATGGFVEDFTNGDFRMITAHTGLVLTLMMPFASTPSTVNVFAGCDHTLSGTNGCGPKFDNVAFYGGFPFVPLSNPFESGLL